MSRVVTFTRPDGTAGRISRRNVVGAKRDEPRLTWAHDVDELVQIAVDASDSPLVDEAAIYGVSRVREIVDARHALWYALRVYRRWTYPKIGNRFNRNHATVISACSRVEGTVSLYGYDSVLTAVIAAAEKQREIQ